MRNFSSIAGIPSNVDAVESSLLFANGLRAFVAVIGPSGWGKTHLMEAAKQHMNREHGVGALSCSAVELSSHPQAGEFHGPLFLDNAQDGLERPRVRQRLRLTLERRVRAGRATMLSFTGSRASRPIKALLPCANDWHLATIRMPGPSERLVVIGQLCAAEGVAISQNLAKLLAYKMRGNGRTLVGALKRLSHYSPTWLDSRSTLRACGIVDMFFSDNSGWDLKEQIQRVAQRPEVRWDHGEPADLAIFTMLREACLSEDTIASFLQLEPCEVYLRAQRFGKQLAASDCTRAKFNRFVEQVVDSLIQE